MKIGVLVLELQNFVILIVLVSLEIPLFLKCPLTPNMSADVGANIKPTMYKKNCNMGKPIVPAFVAELPCF